MSSAPHVRVGCMRDEKERVRNAGGEEEQQQDCGQRYHLPSKKTAMRYFVHRATFGRSTGEIPNATWYTRLRRQSSRSPGDTKRFWVHELEVDDTIEDDQVHASERRQSHGSRRSQAVLTSFENVRCIEVSISTTSGKRPATPMVVSIP